MTKPKPKKLELTAIDQCLKRYFDEGGYPTYQEPTADIATFDKWIMALVNKAKNARANEVCDEWNKEVERTGYERLSQLYGLKEELKVLQNATERVDEHLIHPASHYSDENLLLPTSFDSFETDGPPSEIGDAVRAMSRLISEYKDLKDAIVLKAYARDSK